MHTTDEHLDPAKLDPATRIVRQAIQLFAPNRTRAELLELFEHRTTVKTIRQWWPHPRKRPPQWAVDLCVRRMAPVAETLALVPIARGAVAGNYAPNIRAWHARKKEKGAP